MRKIELTQEELQALCGLIDAGVRAVGIRAVKDAATLIARLEAAEEAGNNQDGDTKASS